MVKSFIKFACVVVLVMCANISNAAEFIEGLEDIPIMEGLKQTQTDSISFGNEMSRFVEVYLEGEKIKSSEVENFYRSTLPQLGWKYGGKKKKIISFYRDDEQLDIATEKDKPLIIRITLKSRG